MQLNVIHIATQQDERIQMKAQVNLPGRDESPGRAQKEKRDEKTDQFVSQSQMLFENNCKPRAIQQSGRQRKVGTLIDGLDVCKGAARR